MDKEKTLKAYDDLLTAKKNAAVSSKLIVFGSVTIVIAVLVWAFFVHISTIDQIKVIDQTGNLIGSELRKSKQLLKTLIENHSANSVYYLNSFDRMTIKENQSRALFLVNSRDASRVFSQFNTQNSYGDALTRGVVYETTYDKLLNIDILKEPYRVRFQSIMTIYDNDKAPQRYLVMSEGEIVHYTAQYPENQSGLYFRSYRQEFKKLESDE